VPRLDPLLAPASGANTRCASWGGHDFSCATYRAALASAAAALATARRYFRPSSAVAVATPAAIATPAAVAATGGQRRRAVR